MAETETTTVENCPEQEAPPQETPETSACQVQVSADRCSVLLDADDPLANPDLTLETIIAACTELQLPEIPAAEQLLTILQEACTPGEAVSALPLITGRPCVPPVNGRLDWARDFFTEGWAIDEKTGAIDFWEKIDNRNVKEDELLVSVLDPVPGEPGTDVFGKPINVEKPKTAKIRCGKGVHENPVAGGKGVFSSLGGKVRFNDGTIAVDEIYSIKGNVSLETGNIHHNGTVLIEGDVLEGASLDVHGDIEVKGLLEPCNIKAGGNLAVGGGIVGDRDHLIQVGGNLQARYIHQAVIRVEGDVMVINEIAHTDIQTRGKVDVSRGRIAGGYTLARKGILVAEAGAGGSAKTELVAGIDPTLKPKLKQIRDRIRKMTAARRSLLNAAEVYEFQEDELTPDQNQLLTGLQSRVEALAASIHEAELSLRRLAVESNRDARLEIVIFAEVRSGTIIQLGEPSIRVRSSIMKPRIAQRRGPRVLLLPMGEGNTPKE